MTLSSNAKRVAAWASAAVLATVGIGMGLAQGAPTATSSGTFALAPGTSLKLTCGNALSNGSVAAKSETVTCAATPPPPTTTTTTVKPPPTTTTTVPPTTTTTTTPSGGGIIPGAGNGGTCTSASPGVTNFDTNPNNTLNTDPGATEFWWIDQDEWSPSPGSVQTMAVCSPSSWTATDAQPDVGGQVHTYPDTELDVGGRSTCQFGSLSTTSIGGYHAITSMFNESFPTGGSWDAGYDLWVGPSETVNGCPTQGVPFDHEIMVWNQWSGGQSFWANCANGIGSCPSGGNAQAVSLNGVGYHYFDNGSELMFFRDTQVSSGSVDILSAFNWLTAHPTADPTDNVKSTDIPTNLEYGVEVCSTVGTQLFPLTGLTFSLS